MEKKISWTEKYRPESFEEIAGQDNVLSRVKSFIANFPNGKMAVILYGGPGIGKTTIAHAYAKETNSEIFELNASDLRNRIKLEMTLRPAMEQKSLSKKNKIILVDEADGITGTDKGGIPEIIDLIDNAEYPVIITANDAWTKKLGPLRKKCEMIELKNLDSKTIKGVLINILKKEKKFIDNLILTEISIKSKGDLRSAINDLQAISEIKNLEHISIDERNKGETIFEALKKIFRSEANFDILRTFDSVDMPIDEIILWVEKNIPQEFKNRELARAYELLGKVDIFKGRIYKQQYWRFLIYENFFLSYGMASIKNQNRSGFTSYKRPTRILKIWMNNQKTAKKKTISEKYAKKSHISIKKAMNEFPVIKQIIISNPKISEELKLDEEEMDYLKSFAQ